MLRGMPATVGWGGRRDRACLPEGLRSFHRSHSHIMIVDDALSGISIGTRRTVPPRVARQALPRGENPLGPRGRTAPLRPRRLAQGGGSTPLPPSRPAVRRRHPLRAALGRADEARRIRDPGCCGGHHGSVHMTVEHREETDQSHGRQLWQAEPKGDYQPEDKNGSVSYTHLTLPTNREV